MNKKIIINNIINYVFLLYFFLLIKGIISNGEYISNYIIILRIKRKQNSRATYILFCRTLKPIERGRERSRMIFNP